MAEHFALQLIVSSEFLAFVELAMQSDEPSNQGPTGVTVGCLVVVDKLPIIPRSNDALELGCQIGLGRGIWFFAC